MRRRTSRSHVWSVLGGAVVVLAGFAIALGEMFRWPRGTPWIVVGVAVALVAVIRRLGRARRERG